MPTFSIIVPIYNVESYLPKCIESILNQTCKDYELILVDDGSPDSCPQICDDYAERYECIHVIHKCNGGLVSARQAGANASSGQYLLNIDGDDYIAPTFLEAIHRAVSQYTPDIVAFNISRVSESGELIGKICNRLPTGLYQGSSLEEVYHSLLFDTQQRNMNVFSANLIYGVCAKAIRRDLYVPLQNQVPQGIRYGEDVAVTIPAVCTCKTLLLIDESGYRYRFRGESIINSFSRGELQNLTELLLHLQRNVTKISPESIVGYGYRHIEIHIISAARAIQEYSCFKKYIDGELNPFLVQIIERFDYSRLKLSHRIRAQLIKKGKFRIIHLIYRR